MLKHMALASLFILSGCADFWNSYQVINLDAAGTPSDAGTGADASVTSGCTIDTPYVQNGDTFTTCCFVNNSELSGDNIYRTIEKAQQQNIVSPRILIGCPEPRELPVRSLASGAALGEESALPIVYKNVTIDGNGSSLNANGLNRHFLVTTQGSLVLQNLTLKNGLARGTPSGASWPMLLPTSQGLNMACGGSIVSGGDLRLINVLLTKNEARHEIIAAGGAICIGNRILKLENSVIYDNLANHEGGTGEAKGAAVYLYNGSAEVAHSTVLQNTNLSKASNYSAAAFHFGETGATKTGSFVSKNSLFVNFFADAYVNSSANYAIYFSCPLGLSKTQLPSMLASTTYDAVLIMETCGTSAKALDSGLGIKWTGNKWPEPSGVQTQISPNGMWDDLFRPKSDLDYCNKIPRDYFGNSRIPAPGKPCMPGAVEPRTN